MSLPRDERGRLISYAWPGGYPVVYLTRGGAILCPKCANEDDGDDPVERGDVYYEGPPVTCDECGAQIESAYGEVTA